MTCTETTRTSEIHR